MSCVYRISPLIKMKILIVLLSLLTSTVVAQNTPIKVLMYNHVALAVENLEISTDFYKNIIGLEQVPVPDNLKAIRCWFKIADDQQLHLLLGRKDPVANNDKNHAHFSFTIAKHSADEIEIFLKKSKLEYHRQQRFDKAWQIFLSDPDGYIIELNEPPLN